METARLRERLTEMEGENHILKNKSAKTKTDYEDTIGVFRRDRENYQARLIEAESFRKQELADMNSKMTQYYSEIVDELKTTIELTEHSHKDEIKELEKELQDKSKEIESTIKERTEMKKQLEEHIYLLKA